MAAQLRSLVDEPPAEPIKKKKKPPVLVIAVISLIVVLVAVLAVAKAVSGKHPKKPEKVEVGARVVLDEFLINLSDESNDRYLKTTIALGLKKDVSEEQFKENIPQVRDAIVMVLTSKDLAFVRTGEGKTKLKADIIASVNKAIGKRDVVEVYFQTFATQ